ncbi:hypothetical protein CHUAL_006040 [Chamberlinius hualienensis]
MKTFILILIFVSSISALQHPADPTDSELGVEGDVPLELPTTTTRIPRRKLSGSRFRINKDDANLAQTTTEITDKSNKRSRTTTTDGSSVVPEPFEITTVESVAVTYRRPKFPPRTLPIRRTTTTTTARNEELTTDLLLGTDAEGLTDEELPVEDPTAPVSQ